MKSCNQFLKSISLIGTKDVARLNGVKSQAVTLAYREFPERFARYAMTAAHFHTMTARRQADDVKPVVADSMKETFGIDCSDFEYKTT